MNKIGIITILIFILSLQCYSQNNLSGTFQYTGSNPLLEETLVLHPDNSFEYSLKMHIGIYFRNTGNWFQRDSCLILDSHPQKDRLLVWESYKKKSKGFKIDVKEKNNKLCMYYHLTVISSNNDTIVFRDQYDKTILKEQPMSFWITNTLGVNSPEYKVKSLWTNIFDVLFEESRVFENEDWIIIDQNKIRPRYLDGKFYKYFLERVS